MNKEELLKKITDTLKIFKEKKDVIEVRILKTRKGTVSGYFNNVKQLLEAISSYIGEYDIYFTINPVDPSLIARANNRLESYAKQTTSDTDIKKIKHIPIDLDPIRPSGISSTNQEHELAKKKAYEIKNFLIDNGFPQSIIADSGNGCHVVVCTDLENNQQNVQIVKQFLNTLDFMFSDENVQVDTTTYNPSRIIKLYGTIACKGDNTEERPHRQSDLLEIPEELEIVTAEQLESVNELMPQIEEPKKTRGTKLNDFDIEQWIEEHGLKVAVRASFHNKGTKYILETCPWNSSHTDKSAYIIKFNSGGICAGCHHNSCSEKNWDTLRKLLEPEKSKKSDSSDSDEKVSQSDILIELAKQAEYFCNEIEEAYAAVKINGYKQVMRVKSNTFRLWLTKIYYEKTGKAPNNDAINQSISVLQMMGIFSNNERKLEKRVAKYNGDFYYDLVDSKGRVIKITNEGCKVEENPPILFTRNKNMKEQIEPDFSIDRKSLIDLVDKHFRFRTEEDKIIYTVYLVTCFVADIPHPILVLHGEKGAAKSTTMRMTRSLVDPAIRDLLTMPTSISDLALILANNYMPSFDNLETISAEKSDMLCTAATGGGFSKRTLYTDEDETILSFKRSVALNGINIVATRADLLDRCIISELERISFEERRTEKEVWDAFESDKAKILGACLMAVSKAIEIYPSIELDRLGRMADFTIWGYAVAEALEIGGEEFLNAYLNNQSRANEEAISSNPVAAAIVAMMKGSTSWSGSVARLLEELEKVADIEKINTKVRAWPKASHVLSKRLKEVKSNLEQVGIYFDIRHAGDYKKVTIEKNSIGEVEDKEEHNSNTLLSRSEMRKKSIEMKERNSKEHMSNIFADDEYGED